MSSVGTNWAGNLAYRAQELVTPGSVEELAEVISHAEHARMLGTRHSFNDIADTDATLISTAGLAADPQIDPDTKIVTVSGGVRYGELAVALEREGWALGNLASLPHISVAGAIATATHGSGDRVGSLASAVASLDILTTDGELVRLARGDTDFDGAVVSLGALGAVTRVSLDIEPSYGVAQTRYDGIAWDDVLPDLDAVTSLGYSTSLFTTWRNPDQIERLLVKRRSEVDVDEPFALGAAATTDATPANGTEQHGIVGRWLDRLPHFRLDSVPSSGVELQSEYLVPRDRAVGAIGAMRVLSAAIAPLLGVTEIRTVAADSQWLSPAYGTDAVAIHFTWLPDQPAVEKLLPVIEDALAPFAARPHWGKLATFGHSTAALYPRFVDFAALRERMDPRGVFRNGFIARLGL